MRQKGSALARSPWRLRADARDPHLLAAVLKEAIAVMIE
jgi:hypothetical protein